MASCPTPKLEDQGIPLSLVLICSTWEALLVALGVTEIGQPLHYIKVGIICTYSPPKGSLPTRNPSVNTNTELLWGNKTKTGELLFTTISLFLLLNMPIDDKDISNRRKVAKTILSIIWTFIMHPKP